MFLSNSTYRCKVCAN